MQSTQLNAIYLDSAFEINGFQKPFRRYREINTGGVLLVYVKEGICVIRRSDLEHENLECFGWKINPVKRFIDNHNLLLNDMQFLKTVLKTYYEKIRKL